MDKKTNTHFNKAKEHLKMANDAMYKPQEDVVTFQVCKNSLVSMKNYLKGYLSNRGFETQKKEPLDLLLERCRLLDKKFNQIDLKVIDCSSNPDHNLFCEDLEKVNSCFQTADQLENLLIQQNII